MTWILKLTQMQRTLMMIGGTGSARCVRPRRLRALPLQQRRVWRHHQARLDRWLPLPVHRLIGGHRLRLSGDKGPISRRNQPPARASGLPECPPQPQGRRRHQSVTMGPAYHSPPGGPHRIGVDPHGWQHQPPHPNTLGRPWWEAFPWPLRVSWSPQGRPLSLHQ